MNKMNRNGYRRIMRHAAFLILVTLVTVSVFVNGLVAAAMSSGPTATLTGSVDANARHGKKISDDLRERANGPTADQDQVNVILQFRDKPSGVADTVLGRCGAKTKGDYKNFNARAVQMPASAVNDLAALDEVVFISPDREVQSLGHLSVTTGADLVRGNSSGTGSALDGSGIGIAVLDSGVYMNHASFLDRTGKR